ncbi:DUF397 domain-containing protein [Nocardia sp. NPDC057668]|uniref:DUF397 domain-containing protein n=1 Tax=Nocardia sp. NPDC057668 TaxID=3346202 RepID=UPI0036726055
MSTAGPSPSRNTWFKSKHSKEAGTCVEVRFGVDAVRIRDSKYTGPAGDQPIVSIPPALWPDLLGLVLSGESGVVGSARISVSVEGSAVIACPGTTLVYEADEWDAFTKGVADGQFDR